MVDGKAITMCAIHGTSLRLKHLSKYFHEEPRWITKQYHVGFITPSQLSLPSTEVHSNPTLRLEP